MLGLLTFEGGLTLRCCRVVISFCTPSLGLAIFRDGFAPFGHGGGARFLV